MKIIFSFFNVILIFGALNSFAAKTADEIKRVIISGNTAAFAKENLMVARIVAADENTWREVVAAVKEFIQNNQSSRAPVSQHMDSINTVTNNIINSLNNTYMKCIRDAILNPNKKDSGVSTLSSELLSFDDQFDAQKLNPQCITTELEILQESQKTIQEIRANLTDLQSKTLFRASSKDALEVTNLLVTTLETILDKIFRDFDRLKKARIESRRNFVR
jgi:hypothetical protein